MTSLLKKFTLTARHLLLAFFCGTAAILVVLKYLKQPPLPLWTPPAPTVSLLEDAHYHLLCPDGQSPDRRPCLCYYDSGDAPGNASLPDVASINDTRLLQTLRGRCAITVNAIGRLGNLMCEYAVIYGLANRNRRPAFMVRAMADVLQRSFDRLSMPVLEEHLERATGVWSHKDLHYWMEDDYANLTGTFLWVTGYPYSWTYFHYLRSDIVREFDFGPRVRSAVHRKLRKVQGRRRSATYIGVYARRTDYLRVFQDPDNRGVVADASFFRQATDRFRARYADAVFVVASDDMPWCKKNMDNSRGDVYFIGTGNISDPISDMALLAACNHSIITIGTYGFWVAYLAGGEAVHLTNYSKPGVYYDQVVKPDKLYLPQWVPIAANRSAIL